MGWLKNLFSPSTSNEIDVDKIADESLLESRTELVLTRVKKTLSKMEPVYWFDKAVYELFAITQEMEYNYTREEKKSRNTALENFPLYYSCEIWHMVNWRYNDIVESVLDPTADCIYLAIYKFARFLILANDLLIYNNTDTENVYSIIDSDNSIKMMIIDDDYSIGYYFTNNIAEDKNKSILEEYLDNNSDVNESVIGFVEIKRNNGTKSKFAFDMDGNFKSTSYRDTILFETIIRNTITSIVSTYTKILNNVIPVYMGEKTENFDLMEYLKGFRFNGFRV